MDIYSIIRPLIFTMDAELAHRVTLTAANIVNSLGLLKIMFPRHNHPVQIMGLEFPNPVGLAAGFDKNGEYISLLSSLGFGFIELGTVTPRSQIGNPTPRLFRLEEYQAVINRMGFNNKGVDFLLENLVSKGKHRPIIGINIGTNKDTEFSKRVEDYLYCLKRVYSQADYVVINISSPNTPGLRDLQQIEELNPLLVRISKEWGKLRDNLRKETPLVVKIAPDLADEEIRSLAGILLENEIHGVIATNTTISRQSVKEHRYSSENGGLSGKPLQSRSLEVVKLLYECLDGAIPIIGCGGILSGDDAALYKAAGASCVQLYTGLVYRGPRLISECVDSWL